LGLECALALARSPDWYVIIACRNLKTAEAALQQIRTQTRNCHETNPNVDMIPLDLASLKSVRNFEQEFTKRKDKYPPLKALINNAGIQIVSQPTKTEDGFETTFGVNHLGHFLLTHLMLRHIDQSDGESRIVFVGSGTHDAEKKTGIPVPIYTSAKDLSVNTFEQSNPEGLFSWGQRCYSTSKLCNVLCTNEFAKKFTSAGMKITCNCFDPGLMPGTGLARDYNRLLQLGWNWILPAARFFMNNVNTPEASGKALARLAADKSLSGVNGKYFEGMKEIPSSKDSYNEDFARDLWNTSLELVKLQTEETILVL